MEKPYDRIRTESRPTVVKIFAINRVTNELNGNARASFVAEQKMCVCLYGNTKNHMEHMYCVLGQLSTGKQHLHARMWCSHCQIVGTHVVEFGLDDVQCPTNRWR